MLHQLTMMQNAAAPAMLGDHHPHFAVPVSSGLPPLPPPPLPSRTHNEIRELQNAWQEFQDSVEQPRPLPNAGLVAMAPYQNAVLAEAMSSAALATAASAIATNAANATSAFPALTQLQQAQLQQAQLMQQQQALLLQQAAATLRAGGAVPLNFDGLAVGKPSLAEAAHLQALSARATPPLPPSGTDTIPTIISDVWAYTSSRVGTLMRQHLEQQPDHVRHDLVVTKAKIGRVIGIRGRVLKQLQARPPASSTPTLRSWLCTDADHAPTCRSPPTPHSPTRPVLDPAAPSPVHVAAIAPLACRTVRSAASSCSIRRAHRRSSMATSVSSSSSARSSASGWRWPT